EREANPAAHRARSPAGAARMVNGVMSVDHPASGALLSGSDRRTATVTCSGTLIGCKTFLTAAHCFIDPTDSSNPKKWTFDKPEAYKVFFQHAGIFDVERIDWLGPQDYVYPVTTGSRSDIAVLTLKTPVTGVVPMSLNQTRKPDRGTPG